MKPLSLPSDVNPADTMFLANAGEWSWLLMKVTGQVFLRRTQKVLSRQGEQKGEPDRSLFLLQNYNKYSLINSFLLCDTTFFNTKKNYWEKAFFLYGQAYMN